MELKYISSGAHGSFGELRDAQWRSLLDIPRLQGKDATFTGTVDTDSTSICVHIVRMTIGLYKIKGGVSTGGVTTS